MDFIKGISCFVNKSIYFTFDIYYSINLGGGETKWQ